jgi:hypothetical protein
MSGQQPQRQGKQGGKKVVRTQETAIYEFLPFLGQLFGWLPVQRRAGTPLPVGVPEALTLEVVGAVQEVLGRGVLSFLTRRAGGWKAIALAVPGQEAPTKAVRLFDRRVWGVEPGKLRLRFTQLSVDALLVAYNASCQPVQASTVKHKGGKGAGPELVVNGDVMIHHIAFMRLWESQLFLRKGLEETEFWQYFIVNPLTRMTMARPEEAEAGLRRLWSADMVGMWPWLEAYVRRGWHRELGTRWEELERFDMLNRGLSAWTRGMLARAKQEGRRDLLVGLLRFYGEHLSRPGEEEGWHREFDRLARNLRFADRAAYRRTWASWVEVGWLLHQEYKDARAIHPLDRESPDRVFMEVYERLDYGPVGARAYALANVLNAVIT